MNIKQIKWTNFMTFDESKFKFNCSNLTIVTAPLAGSIPVPAGVVPMHPTDWPFLPPYSSATLSDPIIPIIKEEVIMNFMYRVVIAPNAGEDKFHVVYLNTIPRKQDLIVNLREEDRITDYVHENFYRECKKIVRAFEWPDSWVGSNNVQVEIGKPVLDGFLRLARLQILDNTIPI